MASNGDLYVADISAFGGGAIFHPPDGSIPDLRTTSGSTVVISVSGGVLTSDPLKERPIAVRVAPTITGVGMPRIVSNTVWAIVMG